MPITTIPGRQVRDTSLTDIDFAPGNIDGLVSVASLRTLGTGAQQAAAGNHAHSAYVAKTGDTMIGSGALLMPGGIYTRPTTYGDPAPFRALSSGSTAIAASTDGLRQAIWQMFDTKTDDNNTALLALNIIQRSKSTGTTIQKTGLHVQIYTQPDDGGDTSGVLVNQTGGGSGISVYKTSSVMRPTGYTDYSSSPQGAIEAGIADDSQAILAMSGSQIGGVSTKINQAIAARIDNAGSKGIIVFPANANFDTREAFAVSDYILGAANSNYRFLVQLNGSTQFVQGMAYGVGQTSNNPTTAASLGGSLIAMDSSGAAGNGGMLIFGAGSKSYAAFKGLLTDGTANSAGDVVFANRNAVADSTLTERMRLVSDGNLMMANTRSFGGRDASGGYVPLLRMFSDNTAQIGTIGTPATNGHVYFMVNAAVKALIDPAGNFVIGSGALATNATGGFVYIPGSAGTPTGTPASFAGRLPLTFDTNGNGALLYYANSAWRAVVPAGGATGGSGTSGKMSKWTAGQTLGDSLLSESANVVTANGTMVVKGPQFDIRAYGAVGDGKYVADAQITASSAIITSAEAAFTAADVGKAIVPIGSSGGALTTTIASYQSPTQVTMSAAVGVTTGPLATPGGVTAVASAGGTFVAGTYYYSVTALNGRGETLGSTAVSVVLTLNQKVTVGWSAVTGATGATGYRVYRGTSPGIGNQFRVYDGTGNTAVSWIDTGVATSFYLPDKNTTGAAMAWGTDNTAAIQAAMDAAALVGGVVLVPGTGAGYLCTGTLFMQRRVTMRSGGRYGPSFGSHSPAKEAFPNYTREAELWTTANAGNAAGTPFLWADGSTSVRGITFFHPCQFRSNPPVAYPPTVQFLSGTDQQSISDCLFVNSWFAVKSDNSSNVTINNLAIGAFNRGIYMDQNYNTAKITNIIVFNFWVDDDENTNPLIQYEWANLVAFDLGRIDELMGANWMVWGAQTGILMANHGYGGGRGNIHGVDLDQVRYGIRHEETDIVGYHLTGAVVYALHGTNPRAVYSVPPGGFSSGYNGGLRLTVAFLSANATGGCAVEIASGLTGSNTHYSFANTSFIWGPGSTDSGLKIGSNNCYVSVTDGAFLTSTGYQIDVGGLSAGQNSARIFAACNWGASRRFNNPNAVAIHESGGWVNNNNTKAIGGETTLYGNGSGISLELFDTGGNGAGLKLTGNGITTPQKFIRARGGNLEWLNDAYSTVIMSLSDVGRLSLPGTNASGAGLTVTGSATFNAAVSATAGAAISGGDFTVSATGSSTTTPRIVGVNGWGAGNAARFQFGDQNVALQAAFGDRMQMTSYWGLELWGNRQGSGPASFAAGASTDAAVLIPATQTSPVVLAVKAVASQTGDLQQWQDSGGSALSALSAAGNLVFNNALGVHGKDTGGTARQILTLHSDNVTYVGSNAATPTNGHLMLRAAGTVQLTLYPNGDIVPGGGALATTATSGFFYLPSMAGTPTGTPTSYAGRVVALIDTAASKLWANIGGTWKSVALT